MFATGSVVICLGIGVAVQRIGCSRCLFVATSMGTFIVRSCIDRSNLRVPEGAWAPKGGFCGPRSRSGVDWLRLTGGG